LIFARRIRILPIANRPIASAPIANAPMASAPNAPADLATPARLPRFNSKGCFMIQTPFDEPDVSGNRVARYCGKISEFYEHKGAAANGSATE